jgi:catalase
MTEATPATTNNFGIAIESDNESLTAGSQGPILAEDGNFTQPGTLVRQVMDDAQRQRLVDNITGHLLNDVSEPVLMRAFEYWRNVDKNIGDRVEAAVRQEQRATDEPVKHIIPTP